MLDGDGREILALRGALRLTGEGLVVVLKRPLSAYVGAIFRLRELRPRAQYEVLNLDSGAQRTLSGAALCDHGLAVELAGKPDSALVTYRLVRE